MKAIKITLPTLMMLLSTSVFAEKITLYTSQLPVDAQITVDNFRKKTY